MKETIKKLDSFINKDLPTMIMLMGIPGCGKSTIAKEFQKIHKRKINIHASDDLRKELFGDEDVQDKNNELFVELHRRIKEDLRNGIDVIYDATNISKKRRAAFLRELTNVACVKICICVVTPYDVCLQLNSNRERNVPDYVIKKMYMNWQPPSYDEGFDGIVICANITDKSENDYKISSLIERMKHFNQENSHHALTLGDHCFAAQKYIDENYPGNPLLSMAALLHDNGKIFTKTHLNARGIDDGDCHYYQHHAVGAYDSILYLFNEDYEVDDILYIANLIYYHMKPYTDWKQSKSAERRVRIMVGEKFFNDIMVLHEADVDAH